MAPLFVKSVERENGPGGENGAQNTGSEKRAPPVLAASFFLEDFFRVTHDGLSERGTNCSLITVKLLAAIGHLPQADDASRNLVMFLSTSTLTTFSPPI